MAYNDIVTVNISLDVTVVSQAGFGIIMFAGAHTWFANRSMSFSSTAEAALVLPLTSPEYLAVVQAFSPDIKPSLVMIGRRTVDVITITPDAAAGAGEVYSLEVDGDVVSYTSVGSDTATTIVTGLVAALGSTYDALFSISGTTELILTPVANTSGTAKNETSNLTRVDTVTETAAAMMTALTSYDDDFYFVSCSDHTDTFVMALATDIEARTKIYFVGLQDSTNLGAFSTSATDTMSKLKIAGRNRTTAWFHHEADSTFVEVGYAAVAAPSDPGKKIWANNKATSSAARTITAGNVVGDNLSTTEKGYLTDKNANFTEVQGGITITREGTVSGDASFLISLIRNRDFVAARVTEAYQNLLISSPVVPATNAGIGSIENVLSSTLDRYVETETQPNILEETLPYVISFPRRKDISAADISAGIFKGTFVANLSGAFRSIAITGSMTYKIA